MEHGRKGLDQPGKPSTGSAAGPFPASSFITARARLLELIRGGANAVVLLDGESGSGKSYLATLVADDLAREGRRVFLTGGKELRTDGADVLLIDEADTLGDAGLSALAAWRAGQNDGAMDDEGAHRRAVLVLVARCGVSVDGGGGLGGDRMQGGIPRVTLGLFSEEEVRRFALQLAAPTEITDYGLSRIVEASGGRPRIVRTLVQAALIEALIDEEGMVCERHVLSASAGIDSDRNDARDSDGASHAPAPANGAEDPNGPATAAISHALPIRAVPNNPAGAGADAAPASRWSSGRRAAGMIGFAAAALLSANLVFLAVGYPPMDAALTRAGGRSGAATVQANEAKSDLSARTPRPIPGAPSIPAPIPPRQPAPGAEAAADPAEQNSERRAPVRRAAPRAQRPFVDIVRPPDPAPSAALEPAPRDGAGAPPPPRSTQSTPSTPAESQDAPLTLADIATPPPAPVPPAPAAEQQPDDEDRDDTEAERLSNAAQAARDRLRSVRR